MFVSWIRRLFRQPSRSIRRATRSPKGRGPSFFRPGIEWLEHREVPAFLAPVTYPVGSNPAGIAVGDFNGDGRDDMAVVNTALAGSVTVFLGNADGTFQPGVSFSAGTLPVDAAAGDLNGDGKLDLVVVGSSGATVLLGNGDGTFGAAKTFAPALAAHSVKVGDFNNDGKLDVAALTSNFANLLLGNGDGTLQNPTSISLPGSNFNLVVGDYNNDGNLDLATSNTISTGTISVLHGHGDGSFDPVVSYDAFSAPVYLAEGDFNHDGYEDFVVPNSYVQTSASVILSDGHGGYNAPHTYGIAETGIEAEVGDFNHDGNEDFEIRGNNDIMVHLGKGDGTFYPEVAYATPGGHPLMGAAGDFNGDGATDLAYPGFGGVTVLRNDNADAQDLAGAVSFQITAPATTTSGSVLPMTITAVDANGNVATGFRGTVFLSSSDPAATTAEGYAFNPADAGIPYAFTAADAGSHTFTGAIRLITGGDQTVTASDSNMASASATVTVTGQVTHLAVSAPTAVNAGDTFNVTVSAIDTQGNVAPGYSSTVHFTASDVQAGLPADYTFTAADAGSHTFTVTLDRSGSQSIGVQEVGGTIGGGANVSVTPGAVQSFALAVGSGPIGFSRPLTVVARDAFGNVVTAYSGTVHFTTSDSAAVLPPDAAVVNGVATANVTFMTVGVQTITAVDVANPALTGTTSSDETPPVPTRFVVSGYPATTAGTANTFTVTVRDSIGQMATGYAGTVFFSSSDVQAGLPASYTFTTADAGVHTFTATLRTAGTQSITARDAGGLTGTETGIAVTPAAFSSLRVTTSIANPEGMVVSADAVIPITVRALDAFGNTVTAYAGTVAFSSTDPLATLPAAYTFGTADGGVHTFNVGLHTSTKTGATWSVSVVDTANAATLATIPGFEVINGVAATIGVTLPSQITAGVAFTSKVTVNDAWGNGVQNYFGTVHFGTSATLAGLPADYTFTGADSGVHTFTLTLNTSGNQNVSVTDVNNPLLSGSISGTVKAAAASSLVVAYPASTAAGAVQSLTVTALDAYGNVATGYRGKVTFSSSDAQAGLPASYTFSNADNGVHAFTATLKTAGTQSLTVQDSADGLSATESGIVVTPSAAAGSFVVTGFPASTAGVAGSFTVAVMDPFGNPATGYTGTVVFSSSDVQAGLPASYTFTAADAGVHSFSATLKTAGSQSLTVKDAGNAAAVGSQTGIVVSASTVASLTVSGFPATTAGTAQSFTVKARDAYGNVVTGYTGTVTFSSSDVQAGLPASYTFTAADGGVHTFSATLKTVGTQSITVQDAAGLLGSETGIAVSAGAAARFSLSAPSSVTQGVGFKFTVTVLDAYGNVVTGYRGKVHLSSTDPKGGTQDYTFSSSDKGVHVFSYTFNALGLQTLNLVDSSNGSVVGSATVNVVPKS